MTWCVCDSGIKPIPLTLYFLFRKGTPCIYPAHAGAIRPGTGLGGTGGDRRHQSANFTSKAKGSLDTAVLGKHSGLFPMQQKLRWLSIWRLRDRCGYVLAALWCSFCVYFLLMFVFSDWLADRGEGDDDERVVYRDFLVTCTLETLLQLIIEPLLHFLIVGVLVMSVVRTGMFDSFIAAFPGYLDFSWSGARSVQELTVHLGAIADGGIVGWGMLDFAGVQLNPLELIPGV
ncbi:unnamed protein product [Vitrella brassicaformis CCMP3155]|uniref:Uncharacterized protein n=1 Tax=Vitrella brassicaformis (strain CCMP3155) TaxID=1169540 RepID=A0A0G4FHJ6_VITBC|nr:unnamed protein product [Vitrella brassicaformis CCMP3155]|eukprot:CEM12933.1 unnamed protein product [Vitrella brassicaformis CCMP3155]